MKKIFSFLLLGLVLSIGNAWADDYALYTGPLTEGDYVIYYYASGGHAMNTTVNKSRLQYSTVTPVNDVISNPAADIIWHIAPSGNYWTIYNAAANAYAAGTGTKNQAQMLADGTDDKALWTATGTATYEFVNKAHDAASINAYLRNNTTYGFACYSTSTGGALSLYKKAANNKVIAPAFSVPTGTYIFTQSVELSCATDGATIYYTTDGSTPTTSSNVYSSAISVSATTTIKAIACKNGMTNSDISSATYTFVDVYENIAAAKADITATSASAAVDMYIRLTDAIVTYINGYFFYIEDASAGILIYNNAAETATFLSAAGLKLNGILKGAGYSYNGLIELTKNLDFSNLTKTAGAEIPLTLVTLAELNSNISAYESKRVKVVNAKVSTALSSRKATISQGASSIQVYERVDEALSTTALATANAICNVIGYPGVNNTTKQLNVWEAADVEGSASLQIGSTGYATYYNSVNAYTMPENCVGNVFTISGGLEEIYDEGDIVPAGEPLVIYTIDPGTKTLVFAESNAETYAENDLNDLKGSDVDATTTGGDVYYALSLNAQGKDVGFYWMEENGAAFNNGAHKAYLALGANQAPARYYVFNEENNATDIQNVEGTENAVKFIENGKLYIQKNGVVYDAMGKTVR